MSEHTCEECGEPTFSCGWEPCKARHVCGNCTARPRNVRIADDPDYLIEVICALADEVRSGEDSVVALTELARLQRERAERLEGVLGELATETWNPAIGLPCKPLSELHAIARSALDPDPFKVRKEEVTK